MIIPKCAHPWADEVHKGAKAQANLLGEKLGIDILVDYLAPSCAGVDEQNSALESAAATQPDGIAVDPVDAVDNMPSIRKIRNRG
jgi:ribose transport system substrate-binding protein